ncbi:MAG: hypothetical protein CMJ83_20780 [Planctomycetes bacterium]|nr:hypothetical protein [Planctomycetota bacterium]
MKVVILFSDTGGGHRAATVAIRSALEKIAPEVEFEMRDGLVEGGPWPLNRSPAIYAWAMKWARWAWAFGFHLWNSPFRARLMADLGYPATAKRLRAVIADANPDVLVSTHPLLTRSVVRSLRSLGKDVPFGVVVTDLVTGHWSWYDRDADRIFVPTTEAFDIVKRGGVDPARLVMTGQAVHPKCGEAVPRRAALREEFGWTETTILLVGGGEGMGALGDHARAIDAAGLDARVVVVCGKNEKLKADLDDHDWRTPHSVYGFVDNLHELMAASDILVSKSGPGSIMEGCVAGLPILLYDYLPGQEVGNVRLVESRGIGHYASRSKNLVAHLRTWLDDPETRRRAAEAAREYSVPDSAARIARGILEMATRAGKACTSERCSR